MTKYDRKEQVQMLSVIASIVSVGTPKYSNNTAKATSEVARESLEIASEIMKQAETLVPAANGVPND